MGSPPDLVDSLRNIAFFLVIDIEEHKKIATYGYRLFSTLVIQYCTNTKMLAKYRLFLVIQYCAVEHQKFGEISPVVIQYGNVEHKKFGEISLFLVIQYGTVHQKLAKYRLFPSHTIF